MSVLTAIIKLCNLRFIDGVSPLQKKDEKQQMPVTFFTFKLNIQRRSVFKSLHMNLKLILSHAFLSLIFTAFKIISHCTNSLLRKRGMQYDHERKFILDKPNPKMHYLDLRGCRN